MSLLTILNTGGAAIIRHSGRARMKRALITLMLAGVMTGTGQAKDRFVAVGGSNDSTGGYTNWTGAATSIQAAIDISSDGDVIWVENGFVSDSGGVTNWPAGSTLTNRIAITQAITVRSVGGTAGDATIVGAWDPETICGDAAVRCVYMARDSLLIGFTLTNGSTRLSSAAVDGRGGGVFAAHHSAVISNSLLIANSAAAGGGGGNGGTYYFSDFVGNRIPVDDITYPNGAGLRGGVAHFCRFIGNIGKTAGGTSTGTGGGGAGNSTLYNCLLMGNQAAFGGGTAMTKTYNCTIVGNQSFTWGAGVFQEAHQNAIVFWNSPNNHSTPGANVSFMNSCTSPAMSGWSETNTDANPLFVDPGSGAGSTFVAGDYRLRGSSPAIDAGMFQDWMVGAVDLNGNRRISGDAVDMGAFEYQFPGTLVIIR